MTNRVVVCYGTQPSGTTIKCLERYSRAVSWLNLPASYYRYAVGWQITAAYNQRVVNQSAGVVAL